MQPGELQQQAGIFKDIFEVPGQPGCGLPALVSGGGPDPAQEMPEKESGRPDEGSGKGTAGCPSPLSRTGRRDMAFLILLYSTAARLDELLSMKNSQLHLSDEKPYAVIIGKGNKIRTLYLLPKTVAHLKRYLAEFHGETPDPEAYVFYSRNTGCHGKLTQPAISKMLRKYAKMAHEVCSDVPLGLHAHQLRHSKASHWLEDGMNIIQISFYSATNSSRPRWFTLISLWKRKQRHWPLWRMKTTERYLQSGKILMALCRFCGIQEPSGISTTGYSSSKLLLFRNLK